MKTVEYLSATKNAKRKFMEMDPAVIEKLKAGVRSPEYSIRYKTMIDIFEQGFVAALKYIEEAERCQRNLQKIKKN